MSLFNNKKVTINLYLSSCKKRKAPKQIFISAFTILMFYKILFHFKTLKYIYVHFFFNLNSEKVNFLSYKKLNLKRKVLFNFHSIIYRYVIFMPQPL